ncbi:hypothetical protein NIL11_27190, partial [Klebsiella pneumoniae]|uniref:hypothetical protein n=1 Tax=Klebsiella pneumoniae TaxID=573 RepID=UPI0021F6C64A
FFIPLDRVTPEGLAEKFRALGGGGLPKEVPERIGSLSFSPRKGFVRGFIDLVFRSGGRYYLLDWKSNHLGGALEDYSRDRLETAMNAHLYHLQ